MLSTFIGRFSHPFCIGSKARMVLHLGPSIIPMDLGVQKNWTHSFLNMAISDHRQSRDSKLYSISTFVVIINELNVSTKTAHGQ